MPIAEELLKLSRMSEPVEKEMCLFIGGRAGNGMLLEVDPNEEYYHARIGDGTRPSVHPVKLGPDRKFPSDGKGYDRYRRYRDPSRRTEQRFYLLHRFNQSQVNALIANAVDNHF